MDVGVKTEAAPPMRQDASASTFLASFATHAAVDRRSVEGKSLSSETEDQLQGAWIVTHTKQEEWSSPMRSTRRLRRDGKTKLGPTDALEAGGKSGREARHCLVMNVHRHDRPSVLRPCSPSPDRTTCDDGSRTVPTRLPDAIMPRCPNVFVSVSDGTPISEIIERAETAMRRAGISSAEPGRGAALPVASSPR